MVSLNDYNALYLIFSQFKFFSFSFFKKEVFCFFVEKASSNFRFEFFIQILSLTYNYILSQKKNI